MTPMARKQAPRAVGRRGSWKGEFRFNLVSFPVVAVNAQTSNADEVHFHQLHAACHSRIRYQKVCPIHGPVEKDEIVMGYEKTKGHYVEFEPEELKGLRPESDHDLIVDTFITPSQLDPMYFDGRHYYLLPANASADEPYALFVEALAKLDRYAIGMVTFSKQEHLVAVRATQDVLLMSILHRQADFRAAEKVEAPAKRTTAKKVALAETLIKAATERRFDVGDYEDRYRNKLREAIDTKVHGKEVVASQEGPEPKVINLMDALRRSVAQARRGSAPRESGQAKKQSGNAARGTRHAPARRRTKTTRKRAS